MMLLKNWTKILLSKILTDYVDGGIWPPFYFYPKGSKERKGLF